MGLVQAVAPSKVYDLYQDSPHNYVTIGCPNRGWEVSGLCLTPLTLEAAPKYSDITSLGGIGSILDLANSMSMVALGKTIKQPWMARSIWDNTPPMEFEATLAFISKDNSFTDVWKPTQLLLGMCFPSVNKTEDEYVRNHGGATWTPPGSSYNTQVNKWGSDINPIYEVKSGNGLSEVTDFHTFAYGDLFALHACSITKVNIEYSKVTDEHGYPLTAKASVRVRALDGSAVYKNSEGEYVFNLTQGPSPAVGLTTVIGSFFNTSEAVVDQLGGYLSKVASQFFGKATQ